MKTSLWTLAVILALGAGQQAEAAGTPDAPLDAPAGDAAKPADKPDGLFERDTLLGDVGGLRGALSDKGVTITLIETSENLNAISGGVRQRAIYEGRTELGLDIDFEKAFGLHGGLFHVNAYQIHGRGLSANALGNNLLTASNIEATRATRLFDLYYQQTFFDDTLSVRIGQLAADDEFIISQYATNFVNSTFGFPGFTAADLPSGGPAFPLATPAVRVKYNFSDRLSLQTALFNGDPAGRPDGRGPQIRNPSGTTFNTDQGALVFTELAYSVGGDKEGTTLPATYKIGSFYHSGAFADLRFDHQGRSLADPASTGKPRNLQGNYGFYGVVDQMLFREAGTDDHGLSGFLRIGVAPEDRNLVSFYADFGLSYKAPFAGRDNDSANIGFALAKISDRAADLDRDVRHIGGLATPVRDHEAVLEANYRFMAAPWWLIQPDFQYSINPGGTVPFANHPTRAVPNATIVGLRTAITF